METTINNQATTVNKVNNPTTDTMTANNASQSTKESTKDTKDTAKESAIYDAQKVMELATKLLKDYKSVRGIKDNSATLIAKHGKDNYKSILQAAKGNRQLEIELLHTATVSVLSYDSVLEREFTALCKSSDFKKWAKVISETFATVSDFVAKCYPDVLQDGKPAKVVNFTNGKTIYRAYVPLQYIDGAGACTILMKSLDNLKTVNIKRVKSAKDTDITFNKVHNNGIAVAAYNCTVTDSYKSDGTKVLKLTKTTDAGLDKVTLDKLNVLTANNGKRMLTVAEYNKSLNE